MGEAAWDYRGLFKGAARAGVASGFLLWWVVLASVAGWGASLYRCTDESGNSVFTDSPAQLEGCRVVEADEAALPETTSRPVRSVPPRHAVPSTPSSTNPVATAEAGVQARQVTVAVQRAGHLLLVPTHVNGTRKAWLILDTGASHTILSREVAEELGLLSAGPTALVTLKTAGGPVQAEIVRVDSIRVDKAEVRNSLVAVYDMPDVPRGVDGLLGLTFLKQFQVTLDTAKGELQLRRPDQ